MFDLSEKYINELQKLDEFKELIELKKIIDTKYLMLIVKFKNKEALYLEAKDKPNIYNFDNIQKEFVDAKRELYSKNEIKKYFELERKIQNIINKDLNEIKESISNKFTINNTINIQ